MTFKLMISYLCELRISCSDRHLRRINRSGKLRLANHAFVVAAPSSWNCLPDNVRNCQIYTNFLSKLKTYYFNNAFYDHIC